MFSQKNRRGNRSSDKLVQDNTPNDTLADLLRTAVRAVRLTPEKKVELELVNGAIIAEKEAQSA